jgi:hypothetical protein
MRFFRNQVNHQKREKQSSKIRKEKVINRPKKQKVKGKEEKIENDSFA